MSITLHTGTAGSAAATSTTAATDGPAPRRRLAPEQIAAVDAEQRAQLSFAQSPDAPDGEHLVRRSVELLAPYGWHHLRMVTWRQATPGTVAHLVVGPGGVVVIDERIWTGPVYVEAGVLRHTGYRCEREVEALGDAVAALAALMPPQHRTAVSGVICVTPRDLPAQVVGGIHLVGRLHLGGLLAGMEERLTPGEVHEVARLLTIAFDGPVPLPAPAPEGVPTQRPSPETMRASSQGAGSAPSAYFTHSAAITDGATDAASAWPGLWRSATVRVAIALLAGLLTYQNSDAITTAVGEWLGDSGTSVVAEG
jgi:hypothetical protein